MAIARLVRLLLLAVLPLAVPGLAEAQSYRCVGKDGKKYYGSTIPSQCVGQPVEQLNAQGTVVRRMDPEGDEKKRQAAAAAADQKRKDDDAAREANRRNKALLATYTSEKDIDEARARALADNQKQVKEIEGRIAGTKKKQAGIKQQLDDFFPDKKDDKKGAKKATAEASKASEETKRKLQEDLKNLEIDLKSQENLLASKQKEVDAINAKYDEDKKRFIALTRGGK